MNQIKKWLHKPKKDQCVARPLTLVKTHQVPGALETPHPTSNQLFDLRAPPRPDLHVTVTPAWTSASPPVGQVTGDQEQTRGPSPHTTHLNVSGAGRISPDGGGACLGTRPNSSLPSSPCKGGMRHLPRSLPCTPLLGGRGWTSSPSSPHPPSARSRLWVEAALQRSRNGRRIESCSSSPQNADEEGEVGDTEEVNKQSDGYKRVTGVGTRFSEEDDDGHPERLWVDRWTYCLLTPCVCSRCPSAPPLEETPFMVAEVFLLNCGGQQHDGRRLGSNIQVSDKHRPPGGSGLILPRHGAPQLAGGVRLYPSLRLWMETPESQGVNNSTAMPRFHGDT